MEKFRSYGERSQDRIGKLVERLSDVKDLKVDEQSRERLKKIAEEQEKPDGKRYIFAPNHVKPDSAFRREAALADDFPVVNKVLVASGIVKNYPVARGDGDLPVDGPISRLVYEAHRKVFSALGTHVAGTIPLNINKFDRKFAARKNIPAIRGIRDILEQKVGNITFYPFGNWYGSGEQDFSEATAFPGGTLMKSAKSKGEPEYDAWENSLKRGVFAMSRMTNSPVVPIHVAREGANWTIRVGEPIETPVGDGKKDIEETMARLYLQQMQTMDAETKKEAPGDSGTAI